MWKHIQKVLSVPDKLGFTLHGVYPLINVTIKILGGCRFTWNPLSPVLGRNVQKLTQMFHLFSPTTHKTGKQRKKVKITWKAVVSGAFRVLVTCTRQSVVFFLKNRLMSGKSNCSVAILTLGTHTESLFVQGYKMLSKVRGITVPFYVQTCMRAYVRTYTRTHARKNTHTHTPMYVRTYVRTYLPTYK